VTNASGVPSGGRSQQILALGRKHWDHESYNQTARLVFKRAALCKTPALGSRLYASENERREFCNTCKSGMGCASCGNWMTTQWQREREWALPECRYLSITFTMPDTLWPLFASNPWLCQKLPEIAATVLINYARVRKGAELGVIPILQTFNGKLEFNPHVHALTTASDLHTADAFGGSIFFDNYELTRAWQRLVTMLLWAALDASKLKSSMPHYEIQRLLSCEEKRSWSKTHVHQEAKAHFLRYGGRYLRRPPFSERHIIDVGEGFISFWYWNKRTKRRETVRCTIEEFIDRWAGHIPKRYCHTVRYFGIFGPRRWAQVGVAIFNLLRTPSRLRPKRLPWASSVEQLSGANPLVDRKGKRLKFVRHIAPSCT
jgi:hypothetical protein